MKQLFLVGAGGFLGSVARYIVSKLNIYIHFFSIPVGTITVNIVGSFVIGIITGIATKSDIFSQNMKLFLMVGICGGFTTFSSFTNENLTLLQNGQIFSSLLYTTLSVLLGFLAVYLGYVIST